ncbi:hypothetical protein GCM10009530_42540 [Microbispora corallina]|uniref:Pentapeptide repeat-containing protein n=1 Tax=Microbispora corallina TaxID=83302 RepID=A0ABQ4G186_9ACTN|nr:pentapeptide repeat-containing protein [Microbispora corallina]GIH40817.1 hypothetical protein Mco01_38170 [Microbispora corallina]
MTPLMTIAVLDVGWRTCDASAACVGVALEPYGRCLAHLERAETEAAMRGLAPGRGLDLRGTVVHEDLLARILDRVERRPGRARFDRAVFPGEARFAGVVFAGDATFDRARFDRLASFFGARFTRHVSFREARFAQEFSMHDARVRGHGAFDHVHAGSDALFGDARFGADASFLAAEFGGFAVFDGARFDGDAAFRGARFRRAVSFRGAACGGAAGFEGARFHGPAYLGPLRVGRRLALRDVRADGPLHVDAAGGRVDLRAAAVAGRLTARLSDADLDLAGAALGGAATITGQGGRLRVISLDGLDAAALTLSGADLRACGLGGVRRPEGLRLPDCRFAATPPGVRLTLGWPPVRWWARRRVLADERAWRGWSPQDGPPLDPAGLAALYDRLRPAVDARASADFAFGAMEMRRLGAPRGPARLLLSAYWLTCGYGLRAGRTAGWLTLAAAVAAGTLYGVAGARPPKPHLGPRSPASAAHPSPAPSAGDAAAR